jgi:hypothetical protein
VSVSIDWAEAKHHFWCSKTRKGPGFLIAPPSKPVVVNPILMHRQVAQLARADLDECLAENTTGWGVSDQENDRIRVSGNKELDDGVVYEHHLYKATGSIEVSDIPSTGSIDVGDLVSITGDY